MKQIIVEGMTYTGKQISYHNGSHIDCPCWKTGEFYQVPCPWHDGKDRYPVGAFAEMNSK